MNEMYFLSVYLGLVRELLGDVSFISIFGAGFIGLGFNTSFVLGIAVKYRRTN